MGRMRELAGDVASNVRVLDRYYQDNECPEPSFDHNGPTTVLTPEAPDAVKNARFQLIEAAYQLFHLASGPYELMGSVRAEIQFSLALDWLFRNGVFEHIPLDQPVSYDQLASAAGVPLVVLTSYIRLVMTRGVMVESSPSMIQHTPFSIIFSQDPKYVQGNLYTFDMTLPTAMKMTEATARWPACDRRDETAFTLVFGDQLAAGGTFFDYMSQNPASAAQFSHYMTVLNKSQGLSLDHLVRGFSSLNLPNGSLVVDIGGSTGGPAIALARAYPHLRVEVQDLEATIAKKDQELEGVESTTVARLSFRAHDFFEPQPTTGAAVYLLRLIIHDLPDADAASVIRQISSAMTSGSRLVIMEVMLPKPGSIPMTLERSVRVRDVSMRQLYNSRERTLEEVKGILKIANDRLEVCDVVQLPGSELALLVVALRD